MPKDYEIDSVTVVCGENPEIHFGRREMILFSGRAHRLPELRTERAYETGLDSVLKFEGYGSNIFNKFLRDKIGVDVKVDENTIFRRCGEYIVIKHKGKEHPCVTENKSIISPEGYDKLKQLAVSFCAK